MSSSTNKLPRDFYRKFSIFVISASLVFAIVDVALLYTRDGKFLNNHRSTEFQLVLQPTREAEAHLELMEKARIISPNLPIGYSEKVLLDNISGNPVSNCGRYPDIFEIEFNNLYWQVLRSSNGTFYFYSAYYDSRDLNIFGHSVRILAMLDRIEPKVPTFCQLWFEQGVDPVVSRIYEYKYIWNKYWGNYRNGILQGYLLTCVVPKEFRKHKIISVSVVEHQCDLATNNLRIIYEKPITRERKDFAVCVKGMDFPHSDTSVRLTEWLELLKILGADKVFLYKLDVHPNVTNVLDFYREQNFIDVKDITLPGSQPNIPGLQHLYLKTHIVNKRQHEVISYNDCFYRNMHTHKFVVLLDIDEIILPIKVFSWQELIQNIKKQIGINEFNSKSSFYFRNVYFLDDANHSHGWFDIPKYMHMLQHVYRSVNYTKPGAYIKAFHSTDNVLTLHNHFPFSCLKKRCSNFPVNISDAHLQHYRSDCVSDLKHICAEVYKKNTVIDKTIWRYKDMLTQKVNDVFNSLQIM